ncbi:sirohydrochlorin chelatase [Sanguibacter sp. A247]|uniref:sirohydrochlorin chelatase n=1 Tax=unclassified Sanguibacter TaxID=2645534 RepID=UPI003FD842F7
MTGLAPVLVGCSHGTANLAGRAAITSILDDVRRLRPDLDVREAFVDVQQPEVTDVVHGALAEAGRAVVVPLLLSVGFHVKVDVAAAVEPAGAAASGPLGPDAVLVEILVDRLREAGLRDDDALVLAAAGSSDPAAAEAVAEVAAGLAAALGREVGAPSAAGVPNASSTGACSSGASPGGLLVGFGAGAEPRVPAAVAEARASGRRVVIASYLLAPGYFHDRVLEAGADVVAAPLAPDERLAELTLRRYAEAGRTPPPPRRGRASLPTG